MTGFCWSIFIQLYQQYGVSLQFALYRQAGVENPMVLKIKKLVFFGF